MSYMLEALLSVAQMAFMQGNQRRAAQIMALVQAHPSINADVRKRLAAMPALGEVSGKLYLSDDVKPHLDELTQGLLAQGMLTWIMG